MCLGSLRKIKKIKRRRHRGGGRTDRLLYTSWRLLGRRHTTLPVTRAAHAPTLSPSVATRDVARACHGRAFFGQAWDVWNGTRAAATAGAAARGRFKVGGRQRPRQQQRDAAAAGPARGVARCVGCSGHVVFRPGIEFRLRCEAGRGPARWLGPGRPGA